MSVFMRFVFALLALTLGVVPSASAGAIGFDDISGTIVPKGYNDLDWNNFYVSPCAAPPSGYCAGLISPPNVAYNGGGGSASFFSADGFSTFALDSGYFAGAWNDGLSITVVGFDAAHTQVDTVTFTVVTTLPTLETFNWSDLEEVDFSSFGGTHNPRNAGNGTQFVLDDLRLNGSTSPEPTSLLLTLSGVVVLAFWRRSRE